MTDNAFPLTALRLRFECETVTPNQLGELRAGSNLRGALVNVMRRATCAAYAHAAQGAPAGADPEHAKTCPVCWLVAANDHPGEERRGYALTPPMRHSVSLASLQQEPGNLAAGVCFSFHITLFGEAARYLPYFVLAVPEAGVWAWGRGAVSFD